MVFSNHKGLFQRRQQVGQRVGKQALDGCRIGGLVLFHAAFELIKQVLRGLDAGVGKHQRRLQFLVKRFVDFGSGEYGGDIGTGLAQPGAQPVGPGRAYRYRHG